MMKMQFRQYLVMTCMLLAALILPSQAHAATGANHVDTNGTLTGKPGATYYDVTTWQDMFDTYKNITPDVDSNNTVFLNVIGDIPGSTDLKRANGNMVAGKNVNILGNGHKIYVDDDTNYTTGTERAGTGWGFYSNNGGVTESTTLQVGNATLINNHSDGIFSITGSSTATTIYKDIKVMNGAPNYGASPIRNDQGTIKLLGQNIFNILQGQSMVDLGSGSKVDMSQTKLNVIGDDNDGEWIQGGQNIEVVDGETTLNQSWENDQPFYIYYTKNGSNLTVHDGAQLNWNLNDTYTMYYDDGGTNGPLTWNIGKNSQFNINGTKKTAWRNNNWFMSMNTLNAFNINLKDNALLDVTTGGGSINLDGFQGGKTNINAAKNSVLSFYNLNTGTSLFTGNTAKGSGIALNDPKLFTLKSEGGQIFNSNIPISINDPGLRLHASTNTAANQSDDLYKKVVTGSTDGNFSTTTFSPTTYSPADLSFLRKAKFIQWSQPNGISIANSGFTRNFTVNLSDLPRDGSWSPIQPADDTMQLHFTDDRGQQPNFSVQISQANNTTPDSTQYLWQNPGDNNASVLTNNPMKIATITDDNQLPANVKMTMAGGDYAFNFDKNNGLLLKANNKLKVQNKLENATFRYAIVTGP